MKKSNHYRGFLYENYDKKRTNLKMKLSLVFIFLLILQLPANSVSSQSKLKFTYKKVPLKKVLDEIKSQSDYDFFYNIKEVNDAKKISFTANNETVIVVLKRLTSQEGLKYEINDNQIILTKETYSNKAPKPEIQKREVKGTVKDNKGAPLPGANILIKDTDIGTLTDFDGNFSIEVPEGSNILVVSYLGFATAEIDITDKSIVSISLKSEADQLEDVVLIGSRSNVARTNVERAVPVDVLKTEDLVSTGQTELAQQIHFQAPSFNSTKYGIVNVTSYVDPATLRGLGTDQTLVLINGKRRHQSAALNVNRVVGRGSVGTDLNAIPSAAIERIEILRNGAAAQYGSDAIAGIVNLVLKKSTEKNSLVAKSGMSSRGDGTVYDVSVNLGNRIANKEDSYLNTTFWFHHNDETDRKDRYTGFVFDRDDAANDEILIGQRGFDRDRDVKTQFGQSRNTMGAMFFNGAYPISENWEIYGYGGLSHKKLLSFGFFRQPGRVERAVPEIYPFGYSPLYPATSTDAQASLGIQNDLRDGWNFDLSVTYGKNWLATYVENGANASYGIFTPTEFYLGNNNFGHTSINSSISKTYQDLNALKSLTLSFGAEYRNEEYQITTGDRVSYSQGPFADVGEFSSSGKIGFSPREAVDKNRSSFGFFTDIESDISEVLLVGAAARFENYEGFGSNISGKVNARIKFTKNLSLRASVNRGFRAPSLHQLNFSANDPQFGINASGEDDSINILHIRNDDPVVAQLGYGDLDAETSLDFNVGLTAKLGQKLLFTLDAYQVQVKDRIIISESLDVNDVGLPQLFTEENIAEIQFFTNAVDTKTTGIDFVGTYTEKFGANDDKIFNTTLSATFNKTEFDSAIRTSAELQQLGVTEVVGDRMQGLVEVAQPKSKIILSLDYKSKIFFTNLRFTRFGEVSDVDSRDDNGNFQVKDPKIVTDFSLGFNFSERISWNASVNNIFDAFPDRNEFGGTFNGLSPYGRSTSQFGVMGTFFSTGFNLNF
ncbi:TonB-dependent receptor [Aquimarina longa]|uniref:TonB-dependent receptor n=1 Tax=Aquimarina longa TaxID=1080221 RepID=UPI000783DD7F|nr:TonB-dependent receptor [Aquimarina longa]